MTFGEKPQSKVWFYDKTWWAVLSTGSGTELWQLTGTRWVGVLHFSDSTNILADTRAVGRSVGKINNATSTKQNIAHEVVILASEPGIARSVLLKLPK